MCSLPGDLVTRRGLWIALLRLFLDTEFDDDDLRGIAARILASGYSYAEVQAALWQEVFPALEFNIRAVAGANWGFDEAWLEKRICSAKEKETVEQHPEVARIVLKDWNRLLKFLPRSWSSEV